MSLHAWGGKVRKLPAVVAIAAASWVGSAAALTINFGDFSDLSGFQQNGATAAIADPVVDGFGRSVLRLTNNLSQSGSAFLTSPISLASNVSFSTAFRFRISDPQGISDSDGQGADGIVFVVQTVSNTAGGGGGGIGYQGILNSVGVELDTWNNGGSLNDPNGNHVGINVGGGFNGATATVGTRMNNGADWYAWVDYDGDADVIELRLSTTNVRPDDPVLSRDVDLVPVLGTATAFIGFTSGTGAAGGDHDIISWTFVDTFAPIGTAPEPGSTFLVGIALAAIGLIRRRRRG
jgi:hypothetical protein